jgi:D-alanyl-D-alanine carboxypeptidase (penicillin-binding protein 5/6)
VAGVFAVLGAPVLTAAAATTTTITTAAITTAAATTTAGATTTPGAPVMPQPPACANAVQVVTGTVTSAPTPLPVPTSTVGGARLSGRGIQVATAPGSARPPVVPAAAWIVADSRSGAVLAACNAHVQFMPASTLKILTALALKPKVDLRATYVALPADAAIEGTKVGLSPGSTYTGDDLFHALLLYSGNDAANALAAVVQGPATANALMTAEARRLGALDTVPVNTSGLDAPGQVSSVYDLALLGRAALAEPYLARLLTTRTYSFPGKGIGNGPKRPRYQIQNHNRLLGGYAGTTGVKNGYTVAAGGSFVGSATRGGRSYLVAVLRADGRTAEMARSLLDWAFTSGQAAAPVGRLVTPQDVAAGRLGDPSATATTPVATPGTTTGPTAPTSTDGATTSATTGPAPPPTATGPGALGADPTAQDRSDADAWAAGLVLGALSAAGLVGAVLVLRRARHVRLHGGSIIPGLLSERIGNPSGDGSVPKRSAADGGDDRPDRAPRDT